MNVIDETRGERRAVTLLLSADLVSRASTISPNLSDLVETLLTEFMNRDEPLRGHQPNAIKATMSLWNTFCGVHGAISDEHSTL